MSLYQNIADTRSTKIRTLLRWWDEHYAGDVPDRRDVDPFELKAVLPNTLIADVEHAPFRIRYRLVGTKIVEATGFDFTNRYLDELVPVETDEPWMHDYRVSYETRRPVVGTSTLATAMGARYAYEFALFPLRKGGTAIDQFLAIEDYFDYSFLELQAEPWRMFIPAAAQ